MNRQSLWDVLFRKQPVEDGVFDPEEERLTRVRKRVEDASIALSEAVSESLVTMDRYAEELEANRRHE